jgi:multicomponent Na+:H+ antiporter subunit D
MREYTPATLFVPAFGLLIGGLAVGVLPGLAHAAHEVAFCFVDQRAYAAAVLQDLPTHYAPVKSGHVPKMAELLYAAGSTIGAFALALIALFSHRLPHRARQIIVAARFVWSPLRALHSGHPGDYVAWITLGVAVFGGLFALALH